ncbi:alpha/beta hydrolase family protein [Streptomyces clavifer]|uniref:hypothetical protein n=1 Tax=Streptomyces clavifer TaxID=68188 RepID=UPI0036AD299E
MLTEHYDVKTASGRTVGVWRSYDESTRGSGRVVVMAPGFGQRMRSGGALALMMVRNGATVYRFDSLDHVGVSEGEIANFCLTSLNESLSAAVDSACRTEGADSVTVVATSLAALAALHHAVDEQRTSGIVLMLGVVDGRNTLLNVIGDDYLDVPVDTLPPTVMIDKYEVDPRAIHREHPVVDWWDAHSTVTALAALDIPVWNFAAIDDDWVQISDVHKVFAEAGRDPAEHVVEVEFSGHALLRNPVALKSLMTEVTRRVIGAGPEAEPEIPSFEEMVALRGTERDLERQHLSQRDR